MSRRSHTDQDHKKLFEIYTLYCRRTPDLAARLRIKCSKQKLKGHDQQCLSFTFLQPFLDSTLQPSTLQPSLVQHNFYWTAGSSYSLKIYSVTRFAGIQCPKTKINISKIQPYTGAKRHRREIRRHGASKLISCNFTLQKDTRTQSQVWKSKYNKKNHLNMSNIYSFPVNPDTFSFSQ